MEIFYCLILFVCAVLNVVLFFKVWTMTGDVEKLKSKFCDPGVGFKKSFAALYLQGEYDEAYMLLNRFLAAKVHVMVENCNYVGEFRKDLNKEVLTKLSKYDKYYALIGKEMPVNMKNFTYESYEEITK